MSWTYSCPWCGAMLNPDQTIVLVGSCQGRRNLIGFHPEPGNYELYLPPDVNLSEGEHWDFFCPVCQESLVAGELQSLCELRMLDGDTSRRVLFSRIAGEHATFIVSGGETARHGQHAQNYDSLFSQLMGVRY